MTKVLIVSDSHGENENINVLKLKHNCDLVIHAGDFNNYDGNPTVLELNDAHKHFDYFVNGNHFINGKTHKSFNNIDDYKKHIKDTDPFESAANDYKIFKIEGINFLLIHNIKYHEALLSYYGKYKELNKGEEEWNRRMLTLVKENNISHIISGHTHMLKITNYFNCISSNSGTVNKKFVEPNKQATYIVAEIDGKDISLRPYII